jgi:hypothetical protein
MSWSNVTVGHQLTGTGETWSCSAITASGVSPVIYSYRKDGVTHDSHNIQYNLTADEWQDGSIQAWPNAFWTTASGTTITIPDGTATVLHIVNTNHWSGPALVATVNVSLPSGAPGSLGLGSPSGSIVLNTTNNNLDFTVDAVSPSTSSTRSYHVRRDGVITHNITHVNGSDTGPTGYAVTTSSVFGTLYQLIHISSSGDQVLATYPPVAQSYKRKVHCNFW